MTPRGRFAALGYISSEEFAETPIGRGMTLSTSITLPPRFNPAKKWPVIVYVYGEPADTTVRDTWEPNFGQVFASQGYVILSFDNQGTPAPGAKPDTAPSAC